MTQPRDHAEYSALAERMGYLVALRLAIAAVVVAWSAVRPGELGAPLGLLAALTAGYIALTSMCELLRRRTARPAHLFLTAALLVDGAYLAVAMYVTGGTDSPIRFLTYLHVVGVSLLASYRTGLKIAVWHSLLLFVALYAQAAQLIAPVDVAPGRGIPFDSMPILNVTAFWLFALATSVFSALSERELRHRRADLESIVDIGAKLDTEVDPVVQSRVVLDGLRDRFGFRRGLVLGATGDRLVILATDGAATAPTTPDLPDAVIDRAWERRTILRVRTLDPQRNPVLTAALPGAANLLVAPMLADGRPIGALVLELAGGRVLGVERRVVSVVRQVASIAALNLRNAALLRNVQDLAERDTLTGAANRHMFYTTLERVLGADRRADSPTSVIAALFIDLDDFKIVNDTLGHAAGDALLVAVTERIRRLVRGSDLVARLGGDEFAILISDDSHLERARAIAERLMRELRAPYVIGQHEVTVTASVGIASAHDAVDAASDLVRDADVAMYLAKANGKAGFTVFNASMLAAVRDRHELSADLQQAAALDQLVVLYQPIVDLATGEVAGLEALVRWQHPTRGLVTPDAFIGIAEANGAIVPIGRWVLRQACLDAAAWRHVRGIRGRRTRTGRRDTFVCVNVSAREIQGPGFAAGVREILAQTGLEARRLVLEITETALFRATAAAAAAVAELRGLGVRVVIDDFGTGFFSFSHLRQVPVDGLKIAREFVHDTEGSTSDALVGSIVALSRSMGIVSVAEGIETAEQAERMRSLGCGYGQGYYYSRPGDVATLVGEAPPEPLVTPRPPQEPAMARPTDPKRVADMRSGSITRRSRTGASRTSARAGGGRGR